MNTEPCSLFLFIGPTDLLGGLAIMVNVFFLLMLVLSLCEAFTLFFICYFGGGRGGFDG